MKKIIDKILERSTLKLDFITDKYEIGTIWLLYFTYKIIINFHEFIIWLFK